VPARSSRKPKPAKRRAYHHGNLRLALIEAALEAIAEDGPEKFTLREAARRAGVSPAAPYRHFPDKESLLAAVAFECTERLGRAMDEAVASVPPDDALGRFRASGIAYVRFAVTSPAHFRVMSLPGVADQIERQHVVDEWRAEQRAALAAAQRAGRLAAGSLDTIQLAASALMYGLARMIVDRQPGFENVDEAAAVKMAEQVTQVVGLGLLPRAR
jgi:AcrR family transcriptional regulator